MANQKCYQCNETLIKQRLHKETMMPPTGKEKNELDIADDICKRTLECKTCATMCYFTKKDFLDVPLKGQGHCKKCGGPHRNTKPKHFMDFRKALSIVEEYDKSGIWSCPKHGYLDPPI